MSPNLSLLKLSTMYSFSITCFTLFFKSSLTVLASLTNVFLSSLCLCCHYKWYLFCFGFLAEFIANTVLISGFS